MAYTAGSATTPASRCTTSTGKSVSVVTLALVAGAFLGLNLSVPSQAHTDVPVAFAATAPPAGGTPDDEWPW